eukprot:6795751-Ditylum_brightwellii.AAC.1
MGIIQYLYQTYGQISLDEITANIQHLNTPVDPTKPIALIWKQIKDTQKFVTAAGSPFTPSQLVTATETLILGTNQYETAYHNWMSLPAANRTYQNLKVHFNQDCQLQNTIKSSWQAGYHQMNNTKEANIEYDAAQASLEETMQNFAKASTADRESFASLPNTNSHLHTSAQELTSANANMQATINTMKQQMAMMAVTLPNQTAQPLPQQP